MGQITMSMHFKSLIKPAVAILVGAVAWTTLPALTRAQLAEQHLDSVEKMRVQQAEYLDGSATAVREEKRDDDWAALKEAELWASYAVGTSLPRGALKSVECRSSKCDLQLQVYVDQPSKAAVEQQIAIDHWIASNQSCSYTMTTTLSSVQAPETMRIFLDCSE
jgi:hypothetical protein